MKSLKISLMAVLCCLSLFFMLPECTLSVSAAADTGISTLQTQEEVVEWVYKIEDGKLYKALYNHTTDKFITGWIYVRDL